MLNEQLKEFKCSINCDSWLRIVLLMVKVFVLFKERDCVAIRVVRLMRKMWVFMARL